MPQWWESETPPCSAHDHERLRPEVVAMPALAAPAVSSPTTSTDIYPEAQVFNYFSFIFNFNIYYIKLLKNILRFICLNNYTDILL